MGNANICGETPMDCICNDVSVKPSQKLEKVESKDNFITKDEPSVIKGIS